MLFRSTLPYIKTDIPIAIVFRALGIVSDEDILNHICRKDDTQMLEMLKPCLEEAFVIQDRDVALAPVNRAAGAYHWTLVTVPDTRQPWRMSPYGHCRVSIPRMRQHHRYCTTSLQCPKPRKIPTTVPL